MQQVKRIVVEPLFRRIETLQRWSEVKFSAGVGRPPPTLATMPSGAPSCRLSSTLSCTAGWIAHTCWYTITGSTAPNMPLFVMYGCDAITCMSCTYTQAARPLLHPVKAPSNIELLQRLHAQQQPSCYCGIMLHSIQLMAPDNHAQARFTNTWWLVGTISNTGRPTCFKSPCTMRCECK